MKLSQKFSLTGMEPMAGARGALWMSVQAKEVADAIVAGTGPSIPDTNGTPEAGTIVPGTIVKINATGTLEAMTSGDMAGAVLPSLPWVVFSGDDDYSGRLVGDLLIANGARFDSEMYVAGTYTPGDLLTASAGSVAVKVAADGLQIVGMVGPRGMVDSVLDVVLFHGICGYND
jgi:hypothetical protein